MQTAEQVVAALTGGVVSTAVNIPAVSAEDMDVLGPVPAARPRRSGASASALAESSSVDRIEIEYLGRIAERDTRLLTLSVLNGVLAGHTDEDVNLVNAPALAEERGIAGLRAPRGRARATSPTSCASRSSAASDAHARGRHDARPLHRPHLLEAWGQRFNLQMDEGHLALFRYQDVPGMIGRVGTAFGEHGVNISAAAVGPSAARRRGSDLAVMAITTDAPVPQA